MCLGYPCLDLSSRTQPKGTKSTKKYLDEVESEEDAEIESKAATVVKRKTRSLKATPFIDKGNSEAVKKKLLLTQSEKKNTEKADEQKTPQNTRESIPFESIQSSGNYLIKKIHLY